MEMTTTSTGVPGKQSFPSCGTETTRSTLTPFAPRATNDHGAIAYRAGVTRRHELQRRLSCNGG